MGVTLMFNCNSWGFLNIRRVKDCYADKTRIYGRNFGTGDRVGVLVNFHDDTISYFVNDAPLGHAFVHQLKIAGRELIPVLGVRESGTKISFRKQSLSLGTAWPNRYTMAIVVICGNTPLFF